MRKFKRSIAGYDVNEVNAFVDDVIRKVENIIKEEEKIKRDIYDKNTKIKELEATLEKYKIMENNLNNSILEAQNNVEYIKRVAKSEGDAIISEARKNANRICKR